MTEIFGVMQKISLTKEAPVSVFLDKSTLLSMEFETATDADVIEYLTALQEIIDHATDITKSAPTFYFYDTVDDDSIYIWFDYKDVDHWDAVQHSDLMKQYRTTKNKMYAALNWVDHGYKVIGERPQDSAINEISADTWEISGRAGAEIIWNSVS